MLRISPLISDMNRITMEQPLRTMAHNDTTCNIILDSGNGKSHDW